MTGHDIVVEFIFDWMWYGRGGNVGLLDLSRSIEYDLSRVLTCGEGSLCGNIRCTDNGQFVWETDDKLDGLPLSVRLSGELEEVARFLSSQSEPVPAHIFLDWAQTTVCDAYGPAFGAASRKIDMQNGYSTEYLYRFNGHFVERVRRGE